MTVLEAFEAAAASDALADDLYGRIRAMVVEEHQPREEVRAALRSLYLSLGEKGRDEEQDAVREVLLTFDAWCNPQVAL